MGKKYFSEADVLKLKEQESGGGGGPGCGVFLIVFGLGLVIAGLFWASEMQGKTLTPVVTPMVVAETAVSTSATPTLAATATATASATAAPTETATAVPTNTPLPTQTPYPTYTPYPSATWTAQPTALPTHTPQATWTPEPTHTAQPTYTPYPTATETSTAVPTAVPLATDAPFLAPLVNQADPPDPRAGGDDGPLPGWLPWLIGGLIVLVLALIGLTAYVARQMRPPTPVIPIIPEGGIPIDGTYGRKLPLPTGQPQTSASPTRPMRPMPVEEKRFRGVEPVEPTSEPVEPVQAVQTNEGQGMQISLPLPKDRPPTAAEAAYIVQRYEELGSITAVCRDVYGSKGGVTFKYVKRAIDGRYSNQPKPQEEVKYEPTISPRPNPQTERRSRGPIPMLTKRGRSVLN